MTKKIFVLFFISLFMITPQAKAEMDPRVKALGTMALYGTVGGTLLGTAALAFDAKGRSVAIGASLGLYTGLLFGGYVVGMHHLSKQRAEGKRVQEGYYPDTQDSPYEEEEDSGYYQDQMPDQGFFNGFESEESPAAHIRKPDVKPGQTYYVQLLNFNF